jgi:hypothetical protein
MRISIDDGYVEALGRATYAFALLEWNAVCCCERMEPNYMHKPGRAKSKKRTAGEIAEDLVALAKNHPHRAACLAPTKKFLHLVRFATELSMVIPLKRQLVRTDYLMIVVSRGQSRR